MAVRSGAPFQIKGINNKNFVNLCDKMPIETINNSFCKYILGVNKFAYAVKGELGSWGLGLNSLYFSIKYWFRICHFDRDSLLYKAYLDNLQNLRDKHST